MDRFNSFATQAKAKAQEGRASLNTQLHKNDHPAAATSSASTLPSRASPTQRASTSSSSVFVGIDQQERAALFSLLDEYFTSRPQYAEFFQGGAGTPPAPSQHQAPAPPVARKVAAPPPPPMRKGLGTATASYDYAGAEADDLSFSEGDKITVVEKVSDDWWKGELRGHTGLFPSSYVAMD
ncbi:hypothetical protein P7C70_g596, partial [Phenoliferia sp. Uapishka_3]